MSARIQEIILFNTKANLHRSTHALKIYNKNKSNISTTRWSLYIIHHMSKTNSLHQCISNVLIQFSSIKQRYIYMYTHTYMCIYIYTYIHTYIYRLPTINMYRHNKVNELLNFHISNSIHPILRRYEK